WGFYFIVLFVFFSFTIAGEEKTRDYLTTGGWYPRSADQLNALLTNYFSRAESKKVTGKIAGIIGPHAGFAYSGQCAANAYKQLQNPAAAGHIERVIILGVSHRSGFYGAAVSSFHYNATPLGRIPVDTTITGKLAKEKFFKVDNRLMQHEHSLENHLPFIQKAFENKKFKIVPILLGFLDKKDFKTVAAIIKKYIDKKTLVVASTDLTHYGSNFRYTPFKKDLKANLTRLDMGIITPVTQLDFNSYYNYKQKTGITMCGFVPVGVMVEIFAGRGYSARLVDYCKSGDRNNDYSTSVSYASILVTKGTNKKGTNKKIMNSLNQQEQKVLLTLARKTLAQYLETGNLPAAETGDISEHLKAKAGVFVTLKKKGHLRGCIGSIVGQEPLYQGVHGNVVKSAVKDYRFPPVKKEELKEIDIEISVMTPLQRIEDYKKIRLGIDGIIIKRGFRQAVFLPQVATETGWSLDRFLGRLCQKAGLPEDSYKEKGMDFYIFQAQVFGEKRK
ncbi:MAG: AmmeMemoRadiSam system protein B, partial [bacterium]|nr:AmmeMemoRadiSam system protein B [bacterium]